MKANKTKRGFCVLVALLVTVSMMPTTVMAANGNKISKAADSKYQLNYRDVDYSVEEPDFSNVIGKDKGETLPSAYSSVTEGKVTGVKDQGNYGTCWAFSATSVCEASLIQNDSETDNSIDLSDLQLAYYFYNEKKDPLGNATGDKTKNLSETVLDQGGNNLFTMWGLAGWTNGATEEVLPYSDENCTKANNGALDDSYANNYDIAHLQNAYIIPYGTTDTYKNQIKQAIKDYGSVACSYYHNSSYYNSNYGSYYCKSSSSNHAVTIVGWNDNYPKSYFGSSYFSRPSSNGAWLVKNSWGTDWGTDGDSNVANSGKQGYFWISYYDSSLKSNGKVFVYDFESKDNYDNNYQYDGSCGLKSTSVSSGDKIGATYTIKGLNSNYERIDAVGIGFASTDMSGTAKIYKNSSFEAPTSGELVASVPFATTYAGYYTFPVNDGPVLDKDTTYSVVFELDTDGSVYVDNTYQNGDWISFTANTTNDKTFKISGNTFTNYADSSMTARIKAYTKNVGAEAPAQCTVTYYLNADLDEVINVPENQQASQGSRINLSTTEPERAGYKFLGWSTDQKASEATYTAGQKITLNADLKLYAVWKAVAPIEIDKTSIVMTIGTYEGIVTTSSDIVYWKSSDTGVATVNNGVITALGVGTCTITAYNSSDYKECKVTVLPILSSVEAKWISPSVKSGSSIDLKNYYTINWTDGTPQSGMYDVTYSTTSSNGSVNLDGIFTAKSVSKKTTANVTVTVTCGTQVKSCTIKVTIKKSGGLFSSWL